MSEVGTTADINEIASYTEYNVTTLTADFAVGFDYDEQTNTQKGDAIRVTINRVDPSTLGYTVTLTNKNTVHFSPSVPSGNVVRLQRETDIDSNLYTFSAGALFVATQVDADFKQIRKSQQEVRDRTNNTLDYVETTIDNYNDRIETVELATAKNSQDIASEILRAKSVEKGLQNQINNTGNSNTVTPVSTYADLADLSTWDGRTAYVQGDGEYYYSNSQKAWIKDEPYNVYNFKNEQPIQYYYNKLGNWDDAIFQAQVNIYLKRFSPRLLLPRGVITLYKPILGGVALGEAIDTYLKNNNIETDFYDSATGNFKSTWALNIEGVASSVNDVSNVETQIVFKGCADYKDTTWKNYGIIHCAPTTQGQWWGTDSVIKRARQEHYLKNFNILAETRGTWVGGSQVHGIVAQDAHHCIIDNVLVYSLHGAGLLYDNVYDSECRNLTLLRVGRQNGGDLQTIRDTASYKTFDQLLYAPLHLMNTKGDNCNFLRFYNTHIEDCFDAMADVYVGGKSSPIWFKDSHHETEAEQGTVVYSNPKTAFAIGTTNGVYKIFADGLSDWDVSNPKLGNGGGYVNIEGGSMYATDYNALIRQGNYSSTVLSNYRYPNTSDIYLDGGNTGSGLKAINSNLGTVSQTASADAVVISNCTMTGFNHTYGVPPSLSNVKCSGNITFNISTGDNTNPIVLDNVVCNRLIANQTLANVIGSITTTSTTEVGVSGLVYPSGLLINDNYYKAYLEGNT